MKKIKKTKIIAIVLARLGSSRLKKKMIKTIDNKRVIDLFIERLKKTKKIDKFILATSTKREDNFFLKIAKKHNIGFFQGSENNVLDRLIKSTENCNDDDIIVRANADNPIFMPTILDQDIKIKTMTNSKFHKEHVESYCFKKKKFTRMPHYISLKSNLYCPKLSVTLDNFNDLVKIRKLYKKIKHLSISRQPQMLIKYFKK
jgi:spore coat polysaccharide biosynthesis protein SpsF (cytidylyltransferase family)